MTTMNLIPKRITIEFDDGRKITIDESNNTFYGVRNNFSTGMGMGPVHEITVMVPDSHLIEPEPEPMTE